MTDARRMWHRFEPIHAVTYFEPAAGAAADALGTRGFWMTYAAQRIAPLGTAGAAVATACFHGFHPSRTTRALPDAWTYTTPDDALAVRRQVAVDVLDRLADAPPDDAADLAWTAAQAADTPGRVLAAANQALPRPDGATAGLWQAATTLREHRGDGHVAALVAHGVGPVVSHLIKTAAGEGVRLQDTRAWPDDVWSATEDELRERGVLDADGSLTTSGHRLHDEIEEATDAAAEGPWRALGRRDTDRLEALLAPLADAVLGSGTVPVANPIGLRV